MKYCKVVGGMEITDNVSDCLLRLPLHGRLKDEDLHKIQDSILEFLQ